MTTRPQQGFAFVDADRTFTCSVEPLRRGGTDTWWWFEVSTEKHQRRAPFRAEPTDTQADVRRRVVAYYDELLARRAAPPAPRWGRRPGAATNVAAPATPESVATA